MDDDETLFEAWTAPFSRNWAIALYWIAMLWFMLGVSQPGTTGMPATKMTNWNQLFWGGIAADAVCLLVIIFGYYWLLQERAADRSLVARAVAGLRALLFLIPPVVFACAFVITSTMLLGLFPHQGLGYGATYAAVYFTWHYLLWPVPGLADYLLPIQSMVIHTNGTTDMLAHMCRAAAVVTLIGAVVPMLGRHHSHVAP